MKKIILITAIVLPALLASEKNFGQIITTATNNAATNVSNSVSNTVANGASDKLKGLFNKKKKTAADSAKKATAVAATPPAAVAGQAVVATLTTFNSYQNYDFIPGEKIVFEDDFTADQDGEFPAHWRLINGQGVVNNVDGKSSFVLSEAGVEAKPRMKTEHYLTDAFTLEFDFMYEKYKVDPGYGTENGSLSRDIGLYFYFKDNEDVNSAPRFHNDYSFNTVIGKKSVTIGKFEKNYPDELLNGFNQKWHHAAIVYKTGVMKVYVDQYRVCVNPNIDNPPLKFAFNNSEGYNNPQNGIIISNVKLANGGGMNMIGTKFTDAKIVTHGINFDVNKAVIKPESMGTLNGIVKIMQNNPDIKFEIGGHTDSDGAADTNMKLSQARADAVKTQMVAMGIDATRLTTKGYGTTKPLSDNTTIEGKANNRRVEFVKL